MKIRRLLVSAGAMKAGTSWLYKQIEQHDQIETVPVKEIHYFAHVHTKISFLDHVARIHNYKVYAKTCDLGRSIAEIAEHTDFFHRYLTGDINDRWYESLFVSGSRVVKADFSNMACILDDAALNHMKQIAKSVRVIYTLRDPLSRLWSHVKFHASLMGEFDKLARFSADEFSRYFFRSGATAQSEYAANIARMRQHFDDDSMKIFYFEDFIKTPQQSLNELFNFSGVSPQRYDETLLRIKHNPGPYGDCPPAFLQAAADLLLPQESALQKAGVEPHPDWDYIARLQPKKTPRQDRAVEVEAHAKIEAPSDTKAPPEAQAPSETEVPSETKASLETEVPSEIKAPSETEVPVETKAMPAPEVPSETERRSDKAEMLFETTDPREAAVSYEPEHELYEHRW